MLWCIYDINNGNNINNNNLNNNINNSSTSVASINISQLSISVFVVWCLVFPNCVQTIIYHYNPQYYDFYSIAFDQNFDTNKHYSNKLFCHFHSRMWLVVSFYLVTIVNACIYIYKYDIYMNKHTAMRYQNLSILFNYFYDAKTAVGFVGAFIVSNIDNIIKLIKQHDNNDGFLVMVSCVLGCISLWYICVQEVLMLWQVILIAIGYLSRLSSEFLAYTLYYHQHVKLNWNFTFDVYFTWGVIDIQCLIIGNQYLTMIVCVFVACMQIFQGVQTFISLFFKPRVPILYPAYMCQLNFDEINE